MLGLERITLVGHSHDGGAAVQFAHQFPERTGRWRTPAARTGCGLGAAGDDGSVPVAHGHRAHAAMPGSRSEMFPDAGHFPFHTDPTRFVGPLEDFLSTATPPPGARSSGVTCSAPHATAHPSATSSSATPPAGAQLQPLVEPQPSQT